MNKILGFSVIVFLMLSCGEYRQAMRSDDLQLLSKMADEYYKQGDYKKCVRCMKRTADVQVQAGKNQAVVTYEEKAAEYYRKGDYKKSAECMKKAFDENEVKKGLPVSK